MKLLPIKPQPPVTRRRMVRALLAVPRSVRYYISNCRCTRMASHHGSASASEIACGRPFIESHALASASASYGSHAPVAVE